MEIDHIYSRVFNTSDYETMKELGFKYIEKSTVEHPHGLKCSFIHFTNRLYLEFVHISDPKLYREECQEDISLYGFEQYNGISLRSKGPLKIYFDNSIDLFSPFDSYYEHRNYFWKENSTDNLPGWNFLKFRKTIMPNTCVWFTEYEPMGEFNRSGKGPEVVHPNSVHSISGLVIENIKQFALASEITAGVELFEVEQGKFSDKKCFIKAVVLQSDSFDTFLSVSKKESNYTFKGKPAYRFERDQYCFDILVV